MPTLKLGLIGCGSIVRLVHLEILTSLPDVELVALAELDPQRREEAKKIAPKAVVFTDYQQLLKMPDVKAVVICLPPALHAEATVAALEHGKHVYVEKPIAISLDEARAVMIASRRASVVVTMGFNYRFNLLYQAARRHVQSGRLGELVGVRSVFSTASRTLPAWKQNRRDGGGVLLDLASHHIDLVRFLFEEEISEVLARVWSNRSEDDSAMMQLQLKNGLLVQIFCSMSSLDEDRFEIYGTEAKLTVDRYRSLNVEITESHHNSARLKWFGQGLESLFRSPYVIKKILAPGYEPSYRVALAHFVSAALANQAAGPDLLDGYRSLAVIEAAEESVKTKRIVSLVDFVKEDL